MRCLMQKKNTYQQQIVEKSQETDPRRYHRPGMGPKNEKHLNIYHAKVRKPSMEHPHLSRKFIPIFFMYQRDHSSRVLFRDIYIYALGVCVDSPRVSHDDHAIFEQTVVRSLSGIQALQSM